MTNSHNELYNLTIEQRLTNELRELVINGEFEPGARLQYRTLAARFGVSITPIRAALRDLGNEGLVEVRPNVGVRVTELSVEELEEVYLTRIGLEPWLARQGAPRLTDSQLETMPGRLAALKIATDEGDAHGTLDAGWRLREVCYEAAGRARVLLSARALYNRARRYNRTTLASPARFDETAKASQVFFDACMKRDGGAASEAVRVALERSFDDIAQGLDASLGTRID